MSIKNSRLSAIVFAAFVLTVVSFVVWYYIAFFTYPCKAFKSGYLGTTYAPGRCSNGKM